MEPEFKEKSLPIIPELKPYPSHLNIDVILNDIVSVIIVVF